MKICVDCGRRCNGKHTKPNSPRSLSRYGDTSGRRKVICSVCWKKRHYVCPDCKETYTKSDFVIIPAPLLKAYNLHIGLESIRLPRRYRLCYNCLPKKFYLCIECRKVFIKDFVPASVNSVGMIYCPDCWKKCKPGQIYIKSVSVPTVEILKNLVNKEKFIRYCSFNPHDFGLLRITQMIGKVKTPIYLYGLKDKAAYQLTISPLLFQICRKNPEIMINVDFIKKLNPKGKIFSYTTKTNCNYAYAIGVSKTIRKRFMNELVKLVKEITK